MRHGRLNPLPHWPRLWAGPRFRPSRQSRQPAPIRCEWPPNPAARRDPDLAAIARGQDPALSAEPCANPPRIETVQPQKPLLPADLSPSPALGWDWTSAVPTTGPRPPSLSDPPRPKV